MSIAALGSLEFLFLHRPREQKSELLEEGAPALPQVEAWAHEAKDALEEGAGAVAERAGLLEQPQVLPLVTLEQLRLAEESRAEPAPPPGIRQLAPGVYPDPDLHRPVGPLRHFAGLRPTFLNATFTLDGAEQSGASALPTLVSLGEGSAFSPQRVRELATGVHRVASLIWNRNEHPWAKGSDVFWAPEVWPVRVPVGLRQRVGNALFGRAPVKYLQLYTARTEKGVLAIGAGLANEPWEPAKHLARPLIENDVDDGRGVIDATYAPTLHAVGWKNDGNMPVQQPDGTWTQVPTFIYLQPVEISSDDVKLTGQRVSVIRNDQPWEGDLIEGPVILTHRGRTFLFYSGNCWADARYGMGYAFTDDDPLSPAATWTKHEGAWISSDTEFIRKAGLAGPGHNNFCPVEDSPHHPFFDLTEPDEYEMPFHAWLARDLEVPIEPGQERPDARQGFCLRVRFNADNLPEPVEGSLRDASGRVVTSF